jgi:hypothetical protein
MMSHGAYLTLSAFKYIQFQDVKYPDWDGRKDVARKHLSPPDHAIGTGTHCQHLPGGRGGGHLGGRNDIRRMIRRAPDHADYRMDMSKPQVFGSGGEKRLAMKLSKGPRSPVGVTLDCIRCQLL